MASRPTESPATVRDTSGQVFTLGASLGRGGQGEVFAVKGAPLAVKCLYGRSEGEKRRLEEAIARVRRLPLDGLSVARPLRSLARPHVGYVMELMTAMTPISHLITQPASEEEGLSEWYLKTGGLGRRLRCLASVAEGLSALHGRGITFGDLSSGNVMISATPERDITWFIDCDNLTQGAGARVLYTPGYGAPELFRGHGTDSLTDAWSFAVLAFEALCCIHPFMGDGVHDGPPDEEERALAGGLPWIDDPCGENPSSLGIPRDMALSPQLKDLAQASFGEGRLHRLSRPGVSAWGEKLRRAANQVLVCPECGSGSYLNRVECDWCGAPRAPFATVTVYQRDLSFKDSQRNPLNLVCASPGRPSPLDRAVLQGGHELRVTKMLLGDRLGEGHITFQLEENEVTLRGSDQCEYVLQSQRGKRAPLAGRLQRVSLQAGGAPWWVTAPGEERLHRVLRLDFHPGRAR